LEYHELVPSPALGEIIKCIWALRSDRVSPEASAPEIPILPDGRMELVLDLADPMLRIADGVMTIQPVVLVVGQMTGPALVRPTGRVDLVGVRFQSWSGGALVECPVLELRDRFASTDVLPNAPWHELRDRLAATSSLADRCAALERVITPLLFTRRSRGRSRASAASWLLGSGRAVSLASARALTGLSERQIERQCLTTTGLGPRMLIRMVRFRRAAHLLEHQATMPLGRVACVAGYADQSHFTRSFLRIARVTPGAYRAHRDALTAEFVERVAGE